MLSAPPITDTVVLVALIRRIERLRCSAPDVVIDRAMLMSRLQSSTAKEVARALLGDADVDAVSVEKARALRMLALGQP